MTKTGKIIITNEGIEWDLSGFQGNDCYAFMEAVKKEMEEKHGIEVEQTQTQPKRGDSRGAERRRLRGGA
jgi:hypothetical protein